MILRTLYLKLEAQGRPVAYSYEFLKKSRCLCNYIEREVLKAHKFRCEGFNRIVIALCTEPQDECYVNSCQVACVDLPFDAKEYELKEGEALMHYYAQCLRVGLKQCARHHTIPLKEMLAGIDAFLADGMKNEWEYKSRTFRQHALKATLLCALTPSEFRLRLQIWKAKKLVLNRIILKTEPDEIAFEHRFQNIEMIDDGLTITSRTSKVLWRADTEF